MHNGTEAVRQYVTLTSKRGIWPLRFNAPHYWVFVVVPGSERLIFDIREELGDELKTVETPGAPVPAVYAVRRKLLPVKRLLGLIAKEKGDRLDSPSSNVIFVGPWRMGEETMRAFRVWLAEPSLN